MGFEMEFGLNGIVSRSGQWKPTLCSWRVNRLALVDLYTLQLIISVCTYSTKISNDFQLYNTWSRMQDPNEDTEWNDILRAKGILPARPKTPEIEDPEPAENIKDYGDTIDDLDALLDDEMDEEEEALMLKMREQRMGEIKAKMSKGRLTRGYNNFLFGAIQFRHFLRKSLCRVSVSQKVFTMGQFFILRNMVITELINKMFCKKTVNTGFRQITNFRQNWWKIHNSKHNSRHRNEKK